MKRGHGLYITNSLACDGHIENPNFEREATIIFIKLVLDMKHLQVLAIKLGLMSSEVSVSATVHKSLPA